MVFLPEESFFGSVDVDLFDVTALPDPFKIDRFLPGFDRLPEVDWRLSAFPDPIFPVEEVEPHGDPLVGEIDRVEEGDWLTDGNIAISETIAAGLEVAKNRLSQFAASSEFTAKMEVAFGSNAIAGTEILELAQAWSVGDFSSLPPVEVRSRQELNGAIAGFAVATNTIYLSQEFLSANIDNTEAVAGVLLEEIGHAVDARLNFADAPGDEGAIFSALVRGEEIGELALQELKGEDDGAIVVLDGEEVAIEEADIRGTPESDNLSGTGENDTIRGIGGNDRILGQGGDDLLDGGTGSDFLDGGPGNDALFNGDFLEIESDSLFGGSGNDFLSGGRGDLLDGGEGNDRISGRVGSTLLGGTGNDRLTTANFGDIDELSEGIIDGGEGDDDISGGGVLDGGEGNDIIRISSAQLGRNDTLIGSGGSDVFIGNGQGDTVYVLDAANTKLSRISDEGGNDSIVGIAPELSVFTPGVVGLARANIFSGTGLGSLLVAGARLVTGSGLSDDKFFNPDDLVIDLNRDGIFALSEDFTQTFSREGDDLVISNFFAESEETGDFCQPGVGFIEDVGGLSGFAILNFLCGSEETPPVDPDPMPPVDPEPPTNPEEEDDDTPSVSISDAFVVVPAGEEQTATIEFTVTLSTPNGEVLDEAVTVDFATVDGVAKAGDDYEATSGTVTIPAMTTEPQRILVQVLGTEQVFTLSEAEILAKDTVYTNLNEGDPIEEGEEDSYRVNKEFDQSSTGFAAYGLTSDEEFLVRLSNPTNATIANEQGEAKGTLYNLAKPPLLAVRGTQLTTDTRDIIDDFNRAGIGAEQFMQNRGNVLDWLNQVSQPETSIQFKPDIVGHSLGGALAQLFAANYTGELGSVITFNSPGIPVAEAASFDSSRASVTHYITSGDLVSMAGSSYLSGVYSLYAFDSLPLNLADKHLRPVIASSTPMRGTQPDPLFVRTENASSSQLSSPFFSYLPDPEYFALQLAVGALPGSLSKVAAISLTFRGTTEGVRQLIGPTIQSAISTIETIDFAIQAARLAAEVWNPTAWEAILFLSRQAVRRQERNDSTNELAGMSSSDDLDRTIDEGLQIARGQLQTFTTDPEFTDKMNSAFGMQWNPEIARSLLQNIIAGDPNTLPAIDIVPATELEGASGAFGLDDNRIFVSQEFLSQNADNPDIVATVLLEEIGHFLDSQINETDAIGDEGAIFAARVGNIPLSEAELQALQTEDDLAVSILPSPAWNAWTQWPAEAWNASTQWPDTAWNAMKEWSEFGWQTTTEWTAQMWQATTEWSAEMWQETATWTDNQWQETAIDPELLKFLKIYGVPANAVRG